MARVELTTAAIMNYKEQETKLIPGSEIWGPALWSILHGAFIRIPEITPSPQPSQLKHPGTILERQNIRDYQKLLLDVENIIPCDVCRKHYANYQIAHPITELKTKREFQHWIVNIHNNVNSKLDKPHTSFETMLETDYNIYRSHTIFRDYLLKRIQTRQFRADALLIYDNWFRKLSTHAHF